MTERISGVGPPGRRSEGDDVKLMNRVMSGVARRSEVALRVVLTPMTAIARRRPTQADAIASAELHLIAEAAHLLFVDHMESILRKLIDSASND